MDRPSSPVSFMSVWREATHASVPCLTPWQIENMRPFLDPPVKKSPTFRFERVADYLSGRTARAEAKAWAVQVVGQSEKAGATKERKRAERKEHKTPPVAHTAIFKTTPTRRSTSSLPAFEISCADSLWPVQHDHQPLQDLESSLQRMDMGLQPPTQPQPSLKEEGSENRFAPSSAHVSKTARRRVDSAVNDMSGLFAASCQLSKPQNGV